MILVAAFLLLVALGLLAGGVAQGSAALQWGSFAASALAALTLVVSELRRRRAVAHEETADPAGTAEIAGPAEPAVTTGRPWAAERSDLGTLATSPAQTRAPGRTPPAAVPLPAPVLERAPGPVVPSPPPVGGPRTGRPSALPEDAELLHTESLTLPARADDAPATGAHAAVSVPSVDGEPPVEEVEVTDLLVVLDLTDEVFVIDEHPRYHVAGCPHLAGVDSIPLPMDEARSDGFTPCGTCAPDHHLADRERGRRSS